MKQSRNLRLLFSIIMMLVASFAMAQSTVVTGSVKSKTQGEGESFATVRIFPKGKSEGAIAMFLTDADGNFNHQIKTKNTYNSANLNQI